MARGNEGWVGLGPLKGQNSSDNPLTLGEGWATDTLNIVLEPMSSVAVKRRGSTALAVPPNTYNMARHVPIGSADENDELWAFSATGLVNHAWRKIGSGSFVEVAGFAPDLYVIRALSFNGKLFIAGTSATIGNRLYLWDGTQFRYAGLIGSTAPPTVTGGPAVTGLTAKSRYYKVDWVYAPNKTHARSELSPVSATFINTADTGVTVTRPAPFAGEAPTHWRAWGSADGDIFFKLSDNIPVATTTFNDLLDPLVYGGEASSEVGTFLPPPMPTRLMTDGHRILMSGNGSGQEAALQGQTAPRSNRIWYTPVLGTLDQGDDERVPNTSYQKNFLDVGDPPQGDITELGGPMEGQIFAFSRHRPWRLIPTGDLVTPYLTYPVTSVFGAGDNPRMIQPATALGETSTGQPAIYFADLATGLYRITAGEDVQFVSADIQSEITSLRPRIADSLIVFSWPEAKQTWWVVQLQEPVEIRIYVFHWESGQTENQNVSGGWTKWVLANYHGYWTTLLLHNRTPGDIQPHGRARVPYSCGGGSFSDVFDRGAALDGDIPYSGSVICAPLLPANAHERIRVAPPTLVTTPHLMTSLTVSAIRDFGTEERSAEVSMSPEGNESAVVNTAEGLFSADVTALQIKIRDTVPNPELWQIFLATVPVGKQQPR